MKKLSVKELVKFRGRTERSKKNFVADMKFDKEKSDSEGGGDYWITCLSAISNSYKSNSLQAIVTKKKELEQKHDATEKKGAKTMYKRNIDILYSYEDLDLKAWRPADNLNFLKKQKSDFLLKIQGVPIQLNPQHVFSFQENGTMEVGAIWFIAQLKGFRSDELGMFTDMLYRYLRTHFSKDYTLSSKYCIAVDVFNNREVDYSQLENGQVQRILSSTIDELNKLF